MTMTTEPAREIIDFHTHFYPDEIAPVLMGRYRRIINICCEGTLRATAAAEKEAGVSRFVLLPVATSPHSGAINDFAAHSAGKRVIAFGTVHPSDPEPERTVARLAQAGLAGIKLHPQLQSTDIDAPEYLRILRAAAAQSLPVLFHTGADPACPGRCHAEPEMTARMLDAAEGIQGLVLIAAHMGGLDMFDAAERWLLGRNIYLDTAMVAGYLPRERYRSMIKKHGYRRVVFGSDCPWQLPLTALSALRELDLTPEEMRAITYDNAASILCLPSSGEICGGTT